MVGDIILILIKGLMLLLIIIVLVKEVNLMVELCPYTMSMKVRIFHFLYKIFIDFINNIKIF
jgi:hypothetical protein